MSLPVAINALHFVTTSTKMARRLTGDISQCQYFVFIRLIVMIVRAIVPESTVITQEMNIAHVDLLNSLEFALVI